MGKGYIEVKDKTKRAAYQRWIDHNVREKCQGQCRPKAEAMAKAFPELKVVGLAFSMFSSHAWCITKRGLVVDPTAHQFSQPYKYPKKNFLELGDFPIRKCMNCGELVWPDTSNVRRMLDGYETVGPHVECDEILRREWEEEV